MEPTDPRRPSALVRSVPVRLLLTVRWTGLCHCQKLPWLLFLNRRYLPIFWREALDDRDYYSAATIAVLVPQEASLLD